MPRRGTPVPSQMSLAFNLKSKAWPLLLTGTLCLGCASTPGLKSASAGKYPSLRKALEGEDLSPSDVRKLAQASLAGEIARAKDREDREFIRSLGACPSELTSALRKRASVHDGVGGEAALLLAEGGHWNARPRKYSEDGNGAWRAVAALQSVNFDEERRAFYVDPDERVRRAALSAAMQAKDAEDVPVLLEVSRLDPDPLCKSRAFQVLGMIGGEQVSQSLKDRFDAADEELRLYITDAWGQPALYSQGGRDILRRLLTRGSGFVALGAARILYRDQDETTRNLALTRLVRFADQGTTEERRMAARMLPGDHPLTTPKLLELTSAADQEVAVIAWARLLQSQTEAARAKAALLALADSDSPVAYQARSALAAGGSIEVAPLLVKQLRASDPETRRVAGYGLLRLGNLPSLAPLLSDENESLRQDMACRILAEPMKPRPAP